MRYLLGLYISILFSHFAFAETIDCESKNNSKIKSLRLVRVEHDYQSQWLEGEVNFGIFSSNDRVIVVDSPRNNNLSYIDSEFRGEFLLELGQFHGAGSYPKSNLTYTFHKQSGGFETFKEELPCTMSGKINFNNFCEKSLSGSPEQRLLDAARDQNVGEVISLLACGVDANVKNKNGCSVMLLAADRDCGTGKFDIFSSGAYTDRIITTLLDNGAIMEALDPITKETPLHKLVRHQDVKAISSLISLEANYNAQDKDGFTPLMRGVETASYLVLDTISSANADLHLKNSSGQTAMDIAVAKNYTYLFPYLVESTNLEIVGTDDGKCLPLALQATAGKAAKITMTSKSKKMFTLGSNKLNLSLMVDANSTQSKRFAKLEAGEYPFTCGVHGGQQYQGKIVVK